MKTRAYFNAAFACLALGVIVSIPSLAQQGQSPDSPIPVGTAITTEIYCGEAAGSLEPYEANITLMQVVSGNEAWERIKAASASNKPAKEGYEYILARIAFGMKAKIAPGNKTFDLGRPTQFLAFSATEGTEYEAPSVILPKPDFARALRAGESAEGWIAFMVKQKDKRVLFFDPASGGAMGRGKTLFFSFGK